jgi:DNA-binding transcriptional LysR family regulator
MNEKHMQYVLTVLKEGSFTAAARKLYVSQPSLSQVIKAAESNLGTPIFDRFSDPLTLTPAGALYVDAARQITAISTNLTKRIEELGKEEFGMIRLGISVQRGMELLPYLYPDFRALYPHVELKLVELGSAAMERNVLEGVVDIALLTTSPRHEALVYDLIQEETLVLLVNKHCALASRIADKTPIDIIEAKEEAFVCSRHGHSVRAILDALLVTRDLKPKIALETVSIEVGKRVTATSPVVMPCPDSYADGGFSEEAPYHIYPLLGVETPRHFYACYRRDLYLTKYMKDFLALVHEIKNRREPPAPDAERKQTQNGI